jgi:hypothetical protein
VLCLASLALFGGLAERIAAADQYDWKPGPGYRSAELAVPQNGKTGFTLLPPESTGIFFTNQLPAQRHLTNQILLNGSGVAAGDIDGDGWCDVYLCGLDGRNRLYRNLGHWKFEDITETAGVACPNLAATGAALVDLDGDGDLDLVVNSFGGGTHVFFNDGKGHFTEARSFPVLNPGKGGMSLALGDFDGDGYLDLYVANYRTSGLMDMPNAQFSLRVVNGRQVVERVNGRPVTDPDLANRFSVNARGNIDENGEADVLYRNERGTNFIPIAFTSGAFLDEDGRPLATPPYDWGLSVMFRDLNGDGLPDLYVCNDFDSVDRIWINQGRGHFQALPRLAMRKGSLFSMGVDFADINRDGFDDFVVLDMLSRDHRQRMNTVPDHKRPVPVIGEIDNRPQYSRNTLFLNRGDGTYAEIASLSGIEASGWSWCPVFLDVDLDGWEDLLITNGNERDSRNLDLTEQLKAIRTTNKLSNLEILQSRKLLPRLDTPKVAFRNRGDLSFEDVSRQWGFDTRGVAHGMALADLDNDGDLDVVVNNLNGPAGIYRNDTSAPRLAVRLKGQPPNTRGIGAKIKVFGGPVPVQSQEMICGGRYLSSDDPMRVFAAGALSNELRIEVTWRNGAQNVVAGARPNRIYEIDEAGASPAQNPTPERQTARAAPLFQDVSARLHHTHQDEPFDDYARQPLLPNRLSHLGPGVAWFDLDGDGWEDLVIGSGRGGSLAVYRNDGRGGFKRRLEPPFTGPVARDQTTVLGWTKSPSQTALIVGAANYEDGLSEGSCALQYEAGKKTADESLPGRESSTGPMALADVDGDGLLDLFVGGRCLPGKYPLAASSTLFRNIGGKFQIDAENTSRLANLGLVSGAVFSDLDGDGQPDLILACEWGPVRVFHNDHGRLVDATAQLGLDRFKGWWNGVTTGDFDGDGRLDIVASNWGRNSKYESRRRDPLRIYYGDFNGDQTVQIVEAYYDTEMKKIVPERGLEAMAKALPFLRARFATHKAYGEASVEEILGDRFAAASAGEANWLESTVFFNRGDHFEARPLPVEAQMAPAFAVCAGDLDGDGHEDLFLSQNFFASQPETPRCDAGRGLWLRGDGRGGFQAVAGPESGILVYGEQRGAALCDFDHDGRVDLVVTQNGAETRLYRNTGARPGLRVQLRGPAGNPTGVGAVMRLIQGEKMGPAREIHAGSGYWSQDAAAQVLARPEAAAKIWVRWPGGAVVTADIPAGAAEITVDTAGKVTLIR